MNRAVIPQLFDREESGRKDPGQGWVEFGGFCGLIYSSAFFK